MSKYCMLHEGKVLPWKFKLSQHQDLVIYDFYAGEILLGQIFKKSSTSWSLVSKVSGDVQIRIVHGLRSRIDAAEHAITVFKKING